MKTCFAGKGWKFLALYAYQYGNAAVVTGYMTGHLSLWLTLLFQILYLGSLIWLVRKIPKLVPIKKRLVWLVACLGLMIMSSAIFGLIASVTSSNQESLRQVQHQVPIVLFALFLLNASIVEELVYRGYLWQLFSNPLHALWVTSLVFALAHHPNHWISWIVYWSLGLSLGLMRKQIDLYGAIFLHILWNVLAFLTSML